MNNKPLTGRTGNGRGFSRTELLLMIAAAGLLAAILVTLTMRNGAEAQRAAVCQDHLRQLAVGWGNFALDNQGQLMPNHHWVRGRMGWDPGAGRPTYFDEDRLVDTNNSTMARYIKDPKVYKCPSDTYKLPGYPRDRVRSVSMNAVLASSSYAPWIGGNSPDGRQYFGRQVGSLFPARTLADLEKPGPAMVFVFLDEHPDSNFDPSFMFSPGYAPGAERWQDLPGSNHRGAGSLVFADGHGEIHKWVERSGTNRTVYPVTFSTNQVWAAQPPGTSRDYEWMNDRMPYQ